MCGPAGSGKSTVARQLEAQGMVRLSFDQEAWRRGIKTMPLPADVHQEIEQELRARLVELVAAGTDVVLLIPAPAARFEPVRPVGSSRTRPNRNVRFPATRRPPVTA